MLVKLITDQTKAVQLSGYHEQYSIVSLSPPAGKVDGQVAKRRRPKLSEQRKCSDRNHTPKKKILPAGGWKTFGGLERVGGAFFAAVVRENFGPANFGGGPMALLMYAAHCHHILFRESNGEVSGIFCVSGVICG